MRRWSRPRFTPTSTASTGPRDVRTAPSPSVRPPQRSGPTPQTPDSYLSRWGAAGGGGGSSSWDEEHSWSLPFETSPYGPGSDADIPGVVETTTDDPSFTIDPSQDSFSIAADTGGSRTDYPGDVYIESVGPHGAFDPSSLQAQACTGGTSIGYDTTDDSRYGNEISVSSDICAGLPFSAADTDGDGTRNFAAGFGGVGVESEDPAGTGESIIEHFDYDGVPGMDFDSDSRPRETHSRTAEYLSRMPGIGDRLAGWADSNYEPDHVSDSVVDLVKQIAQEAAADTATQAMEEALPPVQQEAYTPDPQKEVQMIQEAVEANAPVVTSVQPGDSLSAIASRMSAETGQSVTWQELYEANRDTIGDNPNAIGIGMNLVVPKSTPTATASARPPAPSYETSGSDENGDGRIEYAPGWYAPAPSKPEPQPSSRPSSRRGPGGMRVM